MPAALPRYVLLELTARCNNRCLYCYNVWGHQSPAGPPSAEHTTGEIKDLILRLTEELPVTTIGLTGGEPLLRDDLPEILRFVREQGILPALITNGTLLTRDRVQSTIGATGVYQIPLLSHRPHVHDQLAGRKGAWNAVTEGMMNVRDAGGEIAVVFVATRKNYQDLYQTAELALVLGAKVLMYNRMNLGSRNRVSAESLLPTAGMIQENLEALEQIGDKYGMKSVASVVLEPCVIPLRPYRHVRLGWCPLAGEQSYLTIDPVGNIRICNHSPTILGNIWHDSIREIFSNHPYIVGFRTTLPEECTDCREDLRSVCRGGCKAAAEQYYGTFSTVDPFVRLSGGGVPPAKACVPKTASLMYPVEEVPGKNKTGCFEKCR